MKIGFYLHRVRRPSARSEDGRVRRMVASGEFSRQEFGWARLGAGFRYTEIADSWRLDCIYTEIADARRSDFIYTEIAGARRSDFIYTEIRRAGGNEFIDLE